MTNVQVRDVPDEVVARLKRRAAQAGTSLQRYLLDVLTAEAAVASNDALLDEAGRDDAGYPARPGEAAEAVAAARVEREATLGARCLS